MTTCSKQQSLERVVSSNTQGPSASDVDSHIHAVQVPGSLINEQNEDALSRKKDLKREELEEK